MNATASRLAPNLGPKSYDPTTSWSKAAGDRTNVAGRVGWALAALLAAIATLEAVALASLAPLKTVVPYTITVDRQTGAVEAAQGLKPGLMTQNQALLQSFLVQYVIGRETFDPSDLMENFHKVALWSSGQALESYKAAMDRANPRSLIRDYTRQTMVTVSIKSISLLNPSTALVRFDSDHQENGAANGPPTAWTAVVGFHFINAPMSLSDRYINPLGFQATQYRRDADLPATPIWNSGPGSTQ